MQNSQQIIIIDDDSNLRKTLSDILRLNGFESCEAKSGQAAINEIKKQKYPVALIDLRLADMPGLDVLEKIKKVSPDTECIILTGFASIENAVKALKNNGAYDYLTKPLEDITERKQAEEALQESEEKYRSIFNNIQDVYYETNLDGQILEISPSVENFSKTCPSKLVS